MITFRNLTIATDGLTIAVAEIELDLPAGVTSPAVGAAEQAPVGNDTAGSSAATSADAGIPVSAKESCGGGES